MLIKCGFLLLAERNHKLAWLKTARLESCILQISKIRPRFSRRFIISNWISLFYFLCLAYVSLETKISEIDIIKIQMIFA